MIVNSTSPVLFARSYPTEDPQCSSQESEEEGKEEKGDQGNINIDPPSPPDPSTLFITEKVYLMFIEIVKKYDDPCEEEFGEDDGAATGESESSHHCRRMSFEPENTMQHWTWHEEKAYIYFNSPLNVMTRMQYNWIIRKQLEPRKDPEGIRGVSNFTGRIKGMHIFVGNFTYVSDFMIVEDISSIIDPRL
ncbi:hypothetical protein Tco_1260695 [Tanacetum coccineum]